MESASCLRRRQQGAEPPGGTLHDFEGYGGKSVRRAIKKEAGAERGRTRHATSSGSPQNRAAPDAPISGVISAQ
jgi:hypothetical protein